MPTDQQPADVNELLFESVVATIRQPLVVLDGRMVVKSANAAFYKTFRVDKEATEGRSLYELGNGQWDIPKLRELLEIILPTHNPFEGFVVKHDFPDIGYKVMVLNARKLEELELILLAIEDVTDKWEADSKYKEIVDSVTDYAIFRTTRDFKVATWNEGCTRIKGWKAEDVIGKDLAIFHTPGEIKSGKVDLEKRVATETGRYSEEGYRVREDGSWYWARVALHAIRNDTGEITGFSKVVQNIDDRKKAETLTRAITDTATTAIFMMDASGRTTFMNPAAMEMTGHSFDEMKGRPLHDMIHHHPSGGLFPVTECIINQTALSGGKLRGHEDRFIRKDGSFFPVLCSASPVYDNAGDLSGIVLEAQDITEQVRAKEELEEANRRKDEFLAVLAHELRNPLAPVVTANRMIQRCNVDVPHVRKAVDMIERQTSQIVRLVDDLMDVSRINTGKILLQRQETDVQAVISQAIESVHHHVAEKSHRLHVDCPPIPLRADPVRLQQIIGNLVNNAAKYSSKGSDIWVSARRDGKNVRIIVQDNGSGLDEKALSHVFDLFYQATKSPSNGGLGIGLTLVKRLVELHDGTVRAASEGKGKGSTFEVILPASTAAATVPTGPARPNGKAAHLKVFIIDDNVAHADGMCDILRVDGFDAEYAPSGEIGLERIADYKPDVLLLDIGMPDMDGYEVLEKLPAKNRPYTIAVTGYGQLADRRRTRLAGFDEHLVKPVDPDQLIQLLNDIKLER